MNRIGIVLLIGGFLLGAYATALDAESVNWSIFVPGAVIAVVGVLTVKRHAHGAARSEQVLTANRSELADSLDKIVLKLDRLTAEREQLGCTGLLQRIDADLRDDLRRFVEARESMVHLYGLQAYADIMSDFASGERYLNRVWSAAADGYDEEAADYLVRAGTEFQHARQLLGSASKSLPGSSL